MLLKIAHQIELTGAQIKFAILAALFVARRDDRPLNARHLIRGIDRELMKDGRALNQREVRQLLKEDSGNHTGRDSTAGRSKDAGR